MPKVSFSQLTAKAIAGEVINFPTDTVPALAVQARVCSKNLYYQKTSCY